MTSAVCLSTAAFASPLEMDIAGVKLGMDWEEAEQLITAANYTCRTIGTTKTFQEKVEAELRSRKGEFDAFPKQSGVHFIQCKGNSGEKLSVELAYPETGPVVHTMTLVVSSEQFDLARFEEQVAAKYGAPSGGNLKDGVWCFNGATRCGGLVEANPYFRTIAQQGFGGVASYQIIAERGNSVVKAEKEAVTLEVDRRLPKSGSAAF